MVDRASKRAPRGGLVGVLRSRAFSVSTSFWRDGQRRASRVLANCLAQRRRPVGQPALKRVVPLRPGRLSRRCRPVRRRHPSRDPAASPTPRAHVEREVPSSMSNAAAADSRGAADRGRRSPGRPAPRRGQAGSGASSEAARITWAAASPIAPPPCSACRAGAIARGSFIGSITRRIVSRASSVRRTGVGCEQPLDRPRPDHGRRAAAASRRTSSALESASTSRRTSADADALITM